VSPEYLTPGGDQDENFLRAFSPGKGPLFSSEMVESPIASPTPTTAERLDPTKMVCPITQVKKNVLRIANDILQANSFFFTGNYG
jgi:hypothetical protein